MNKSVIPKNIVDEKIGELRISDPGRANIREIVALVNEVEVASGIKYIRMEMGIPGLPPAKVGVDAEIEAMKSGVASIYPPIDGIKPLKSEASRFIKNFMDIDVAPRGCIPTVGSMQGTYAAFLVAGNLVAGKDTALFIDPGFPVQKQQLDVLGLKYKSFDVFNFRGPKLRAKLEELLGEGNICSIIYSNPNNPAWICLTDEELQIIGDLANRYDLVVMEDLAYFAMDFRQDLFSPGQPPYQSTVARYTQNYVIFISGSKIFSYAGQRIAIVAVSDQLFCREYPNLLKRFGISEFGNVLLMRVLYALTSGASHSAQYALAAMFKAANDGDFNFVSDIKEYGEKARIMKKMFTENGFYIVYDDDLGEPIGDGFYFTIGYPDMTGTELVHNLFYYGISAIALCNTGSEREGIRACVSHVKRQQFADLEERLKLFNENFKK